MPGDDIPDDFVKPPTREDLEELRDMLRRVGKDEEKIENWIKICAIKPEHYYRLRETYRIHDAETVTKDPFLPYDPYHGRFRIGTNPDGDPVGLTAEELNEHLMAVGRSGAGKTTFFLNLIDTCLGEQLPFLIFDFKNDYRHLARHRDLLVINWRDLKFNPLQPPPGVRTARWAEVLADTWTHAVGLLNASRNYFLRKLRDLYQLYDTEQGEWPSLFELLKLVRVDQIPYASPRYRYKERLDNRLTGMTGFSGTVFDCSQSFPFQEFLDRNVVVELQEPMEDTQIFVVEALLTWIFYYREAQGHRDGLRHVVLLDEAKQVFDRQREENSESPNPPVTKLMGQVREFGEALVVADHEPSKLSDSLKANTNAKLWLSLGSGKDIEEMADTFGTEYEETDFTRTLEKGEALLKLADRNPVPVDLPDYPLEKTMTESEIREMMAPELEQLSWEPRVRSDRFKDVVGDWDDPETDDEEEGEGELEALSDLAEALLVDVTAKEFLSMSDRYDRLDVGKKAGTAAKNELRDQDLVRVSTVRNGKRGRNPKMLDLTQKGCELLEEMGYAVPAIGRRGIEHRYWQEQIKQYYDGRGFDVEIEYGIGKNHIDVYAERDGEQVAVEVARSLEHELANIQKCLAADVDQVEVAYLDEQVKGQIESAVREEFGRVPARVGFVPVSDYV